MKVRNIAIMGYRSVGELMKLIRIFLQFISNNEMNFNHNLLN